MIALNIDSAKEDNFQCLTPEIQAVESHAYESYVEGASNLADISPDISRLNEGVVRDVKPVAKFLFSNLLNAIEADLSNPRVGIAVVDIPESSKYSQTENAFWGVALALALGSNIFSFDRDRINGTPYTVYAASYRKSQGLTELGLQPVAPETKLGFHTDGVLVGETVAMPINIMLYNISIEYQRPGNFYWLPFSLWSESDVYKKRIGIGRPYDIKLTPSVYEIADGHLEVVSPMQVTVPIFVSTKSFATTLYLNGDIVPSAVASEFESRAIEDLRASLAANRVRFCVPQKTRRVIFVRNVFGAHARDIFEGPNPDAPYTRIFLRSVDQSCIDLVNRTV